jgi:hypothetical protein
MKIDELTNEQQDKISEYRNRYFQQATSTDPSDRPRAEVSARKMADIAGVKIKEIYWVLSPDNGASLSDSLRASLSDSLSDTGWLVYYTYAVDTIGIEVTDSMREKLRLYNEIAASCFAMWILPGTVILCDRPESVEIVNGKLIDLKWRTK